MAGVETFKQRTKYGWRLRNGAGAIEFTRAAAFATAGAARVNALSDTRLAMTSLGITEGPPVAPPVEAPSQDLHVDAGLGEA